MKVAATIHRNIFAISLLLFVGCSSDGGLMQFVLDENDLEMSPTTPAALLSAYENALRKRDDSSYAALLDDNFEFDPLDRDATDWPWFDGIWGKDEELSVIGNMFDPSFGGRNPIDTIECELTAIGEPIAEGNVIHISCNLQGMILTLQNDGWSFDTMLEMTLVRHGDVLRIQRIAEKDPGQRSAVPEFGFMTWGSMKALFYSEPPIPLRSAAG